MDGVFISLVNRADYTIMAFSPLNCSLLLSARVTNLREKYRHPSARVG